MPRPQTTFPQFLAWCRAYVRRRRRVYGESRAQAVSRLRRALESRDPSWQYHMCGNIHCDRPVVDNPDESGNGNFACGACGRCESHCECTWCQNCGDECSDDYCSDCSNCRSCCTCVFCAECDERCDSGDRCRGCQRCSSCECNCEDQACNVRFIRAPETPTFHAPQNAMQRKGNPSPRYVSCEIEVASVKRGNRVSEVVDKWGGAIVHDGSLPSSGFEINTAPAGGDLFLGQISEICDALNERQAKVTDACGLHVHINAKDFDFYSLRRLVKVYAKIEDALYQMVPASRRTSTYCKPCGRHYMETMAAGKVPKDVKIGVLQSVYHFKPDCKYGARDLQNSKRQKYHESRYNNLNVHSFFYRGTVEVRMHAGSTNTAKIQSWGMMWAHILDYSLANSDREIDLLFTGKNSRQALLAVCETSRARARLTAFVNERLAKLGTE
jgi:hypothetical protein